MEYRSGGNNTVNMAWHGVLEGNQKFGQQLKLDNELQGKMCLLSKNWMTEASR